MPSAGKDCIPGSLTPLADGVAVITGVLKTMPSLPGVYRMLSVKGDVLYVGKAKNLKKRVSNYTHPDRQTLRIQRMIAETASMEVVTTHTEAEALLLESNLIKKLAPRYNILLRDDKSFPYILVTADHDWPMVVKHRGARNRAGQYFGPFASAGSVNQVLTILQRAFLLRTCTDAVFASRTRPCLLYQIKRCCGPCADRISQSDYQALVGEARDFLTGHSHAVQQSLSLRMAEAAEAMEYERAAQYRDRIRAMAHVHMHQDVNPLELGDADVVALYQAGGHSCVQVFFFRAGFNCGTRSYFPSHTQDATLPDILAAFLGQFYADKEPPSQILLSDEPSEPDLLAQALSDKAGRKVHLTMPKRGDRRRVLDHALDNAREALGRRMAESGAQAQLLQGVADVFSLDGPPERIEVYDNSHIQGAHAVGAMIVAGPQGMDKSAYRKFTIREPGAAGDDFAMMREVLTRRFGRALTEDPDRDRGLWPDLVLIDGGQGQLSAALAVLADLGIQDVPLVGIAKGVDRDAGRERFFMEGREPFGLPLRDPVLYFLQRLRDEAHRFAIGTHRAKRSKAIGQSLLDEVPGIGANRKRALLHHFGSARAVGEAGLKDLEAVPGISKAMAKKLYDHFHS